MAITSPGRKLFFLPILLGLAAFVATPAEAQQGQQGNSGQSASGGYASGYAVPRGPRRAGGYSLTLSDIWGPAKMPPAPKDFGPHFDFPPEPLNGAPLHDPYPN